MEELENNRIVPKDRIASFALFIGFVAIPMSISIIPGVLLGILAITLGVVSRIQSEKYSLNNVLGIVFGVIALFLAAVVFLGTIMLLKDPEVLEQLSQIMQMYYQK